MKIESSAKNLEVAVPEHGNLPLYYSLTGEVEPAFAPLSIDYSLDANNSYRYDWIVGVGPAKPADGDYLDHLRKGERAVTVQLVVDCGEGLSFSDSSPMLVGLNPSLKASSSWLEAYGPDIREAVKGAAPLVAGLATPVFPLASVASSAVQLAANFIAPGRGDEQSWYAYRFLDGEKKCCVIEWNLKKSVLRQYGPLLRGSIILSFHGRQRGKSEVTLLLRPRLGFEGRALLDYLPPLDDLESEQPVHLSIRPQ